MKDLEWGLGGTYVIRCSRDARPYYGSTKNLKARWVGHKTKMKRGVHGNSKLQDLWNAHGEESFTFEVIELIQDREAREQAEQALLDGVKDWSRVLNYVRRVTFTESQVLSVRERYSKGNITQGELAEEYRVENTTIRRIVTGEAYPHFDGPLYEPPSHFNLTDAEVYNIRMDYWSGVKTQKVISSEMGISKSNTSRICLGKTHSDAAGPTSKEEYNQIIAQEAK